MPVTSCGIFIPRGEVLSQCRRFSGDLCSFSCDPGCRRTRASLRCSYSGEWEGGDEACNCVQNSRDSTTLTPVDVDDVEDGSSGAGLNNSLIVAVTVATGVAVFLLVAGCLAYLIYRRQQQIARRRNQAAASNLPVIYHEVATQPQLADSGRRYLNPTYSTAAAVNEPNQYMITDTRPAPSAPEWQPNSDTPRNPANSQDFESPPSYGEVTHHPQKFKQNR